MISNLQKKLIEAAAEEQPDLVIDILAIAALMQDFDSVIYITENYQHLFPEEDRAKVQELHDAAVKIQAAVEREGAAVH